MMRSLLAQGVSADLETTYGESPLSVSALIGDLDAIELLLGAGANPKPLGWTPIFHAVAFGDFAEIVRLLRKGVDREVRDRWEQTALLFAIKCGDLDKAKLLLDAGFDLAAQARGGRTALQIAAAQNHAALIAWLVDRGILPNDANGFGETPLMAAAEGDSFEAMNVLLERGADPALENHVQSMAVHHASTLRTITRLVQARPEHINAIDGCGEWPLKGAAAANQVALIDGLHALGATIDLTRTGETALHDAIRTDALEAARRLLELGANPNAQDVDGWTPLFSVRSREAAQLLMQFGADPLIGDEVEARASESIDDLLVLELLPKL